MEEIMDFINWGDLIPLLLVGFVIILMWLA
jgi:hypothetical protein